MIVSVSAKLQINSHYGAGKPVLSPLSGLGSLHLLRRAGHPRVPRTVTSLCGPLLTVTVRCSGGRGLYLLNLGPLPFSISIRLLAVCLQRVPLHLPSGAFFFFDFPFAQIHQCYTDTPTISCFPIRSHQGGRNSLRKQCGNAFVNADSTFILSERPEPSRRWMPSVHYNVIPGTRTPYFSVFNLTVRHAKNTS